MKLRRFRSIAVVVLLASTQALSCSKSKSADGGPAGSATVAAGSPLAFLNGFEGEVGIAIKGGPKAHATGEMPPLSLMIKSDKVRVEIPPGLGGGSHPMNLKGYVILDTPQKKLSVVMDDQKQVLVIDLNKAGEQLKSLQPGGAPEGAPGKPPSRPAPTVTKTGVTDKVAGYSCETWEVAEEGKKVAALCIANEGASWFHLPITGIPTEYAWALELMDGKHFPMRAIGFEKDGTEQGRVEVTKLEKKTIAPALFEIPPTYKVVDLATMFQQMAGLSHGGAAFGAAGTHPAGFPAGSLPALPPGVTLPKKHK